jgi:hypothetical protein
VTAAPAIPRAIPAATMASSLPLDSRELRQAVGMFGSDVLGRWGAEQKVKKWALARSGNAYRAKDGRAVPGDLLAHLTGAQTLAVGPITRSIVIDADLVSKGQEASAELKVSARAAVDAVLSAFGIPALHFDSARGSHTWIRCNTTPTPETLASFERAIGGQYDGPGKIEVYPQGGKAIRLPWGVYLGVERRPVPDMPNEELMTWFSWPERASAEQLAAVEREFPPPPPPRPQEKKALPAPAPTPETTADALSAPPGRLHSPAPCAGWGKWPVCKQLVAINGPLAGRRHNTLLTLACEAVVSGERDETRLLDFLLAVPRPHSETTAAEHHKDAYYAARDALELHAANDPRRFSSCPRVPTHSGLAATSQHRSTFEHVCDEEKAAICTIHRRWQREQNLPAYDHILRSSIWRNSQGAGLGLGPAAKAVYRLLLYLSGGDTERTISASHNYVAVKLTNEVRLPTVRRLKGKLLLYGLIVQMEGSTHHYRVPLLSPARVSELEAQLGTDVLEARAKQEILDRWDDSAKFKSRR